MRGIDAAASGDAIATAQSVNTIASGGACVASRSADADASANIQVEFGLKLKTHMTGRFRFESFSRSLN